MQCIGRYGRRPVKPKAGQSVSDEVLAHCRAANDRLRERYLHLVSDGKLAKNKAKVAVVNEMIRWVWAVGCMVQDERAAAEEGR